MIEDLDGATIEPSRRRHVAVLSASVVALAIVLFCVLVAPPNFVGAPPQVASPWPNQSSVMTVVSNPLIHMPLDTTTSGLCSDRTTWSLQLAVGVSGETSFVVYDRTVNRPVAFVREELGTGRLIVTCATPERVAPRINRTFDGP